MTRPAREQTSAQTLRTDGTGAGDIKSEANGVGTRLLSTSTATSLSALDASGEKDGTTTDACSRPDPADEAGRNADPIEPVQ